MANSGSGTHVLDSTRTNHVAITHTVFMLQRTGNHVSDNFHVLMTVSWEPTAGNDLVFIDHSYISETHEIRVVVTAKLKSMPCVQPGELYMTTLF